MVQTVEGAVVRNTELIADSEKVMMQWLTMGMMMMMMIMMVMIMVASIWTVRSTGTW